MLTKFHFGQLPTSASFTRAGSHMCVCKLFFFSSLSLSLSHSLFLSHFLCVWWLAWWSLQGSHIVTFIDLLQKPCQFQQQELLQRLFQWWMRWWCSLFCRVISYSPVFQIGLIFHNFVQLCISVFFATLNIMVILCIWASCSRIQEQREWEARTAVC